MLQTQGCLALRGSSSLAEVSDFQGSRMRGLKQKVKVCKQKNATELPSWIFPAEHNAKNKQLAQMTNAGLPEGWSKTCWIQQYVLHRVRRSFASGPLQGRQQYFLKEKCHLKKCGKFSCSTSYMFLLSNSHWSYFRLDLRVLSTARRLNDMLFKFSDNIMIYLLLYLAVTFILLINKPT